MSENQLQQATQGDQIMQTRERSVQAPIETRQKLERAGCCERCVAQPVGKTLSKQVYNLQKAINESRAKGLKDDSPELKSLIALRNDAILQIDALESGKPDKAPPAVRSFLAQRAPLSQGVMRTPPPPPAATAPPGPAPAPGMISPPQVAIAPGIPREKWSEQQRRDIAQAAREFAEAGGWKVPQVSGKAAPPVQSFPGAVPIRTKTAYRGI